MPLKITIEEHLAFAVGAALAFGYKPDMDAVSKLTGLSASVAENRWAKMRKDFEQRGDVKTGDEDAGSAKGSSSSASRNPKRKFGDGDVEVDSGMSPVYYNKFTPINIKKDDTPSGPPRKRGRPSKAALAARSRAAVAATEAVVARYNAQVVEAASSKEDKKGATTSGNKEPSEEAVAKSADGLPAQVADWLAAGYVAGPTSGGAIDLEDPDL